jgi:D-alanyl-D-alanine carboxypeptidase
MSLGWHIGALKGDTYYFKEGGGAGFHSEMRIYPARRLASVIIVNATDFRSNAVLSDLDHRFVESSNDQPGAHDAPQRGKAAADPGDVGHEER